MKRWVIMGGALMAAAWVPFLYSELSSEPAQKRARDVYTDAKEQPLLAVEPPSAEPEKAVPVPAEAPRAEAPAVEAALAPAAAAEPAAAAPPDAGAAQQGANESAPLMPMPLDVLKQAFETEPRDALWATDAESRIGTFFGTKELPAEMLRNASCRRAVCRVQLNWKMGTAQEALGVIGERVRQEFGSEAALLPLGSSEGEDVGRLDLYFHRKGFTVADLSK